MIAFVRDVGPESDRGAKSREQRSPASSKTLRKQHERLVTLLKQAGLTVECFPSLGDVESSLLVGDLAVLLPETSILARPQDASRLRELDSILGTLGQHRPVQSIVDPGTLDAADVLRIGRSLYVTESARTNADGIAQLREIAASHGYNLRVLTTLGVGSLKAACSFIPPHFVLVNPGIVDAAGFENVITLPVDDNEPGGATTFTIGSTTVVAASAPKTEKKLNEAGVKTTRLDISEFEKMNAGLASLVLFLEPRTTNHSVPENGIMPVLATGVPLLDRQSTPAIVHSDLVFTSQVLPFDPSTAAAKRTSVEEQTELMLRNLAIVLSASGSSLGQIVRTTLHVADPKHLARVDAVWPRLFGNHRPARAVVANSALPSSVLVSVEAVAARGKRGS